MKTLKRVILMTELAKTEYLYASSRIRAMENSLINSDRIRRMAEARSDMDAVRILEECGYGEKITPDNIYGAINTKRKEIFDDMEKMLPEKKYVTFFRYRYDCHNVKTLLKGVFAEDPANDLISEAGTIPKEKIISGFSSEEYSDYPRHLRESVQEAEEVLKRTHDPQLSDSIIDKNMFRQMEEVAAETENKFLMEYLNLISDLTNIKMAVRLKNMNVQPDRINDFFIETGTIPRSFFEHDITSDTSGYIPDDDAQFADLIAAGLRVLKKEKDLSYLDMVSDNITVDFLRQTKSTGFGAELAVAYLAAFEMECVMIQKLMALRKKNDDPSEIIEKTGVPYA